MDISIVAHTVQSNVSFEENYNVASGFQGWTLETTGGGVLSNLMPGSSDMTSALHDCAGTILLGGYNICGMNCELRKTFTDLPGHNFVYLEVEVFWLDNWDKRWLYIYGDDIPVFSQRKEYRYPAESSSLKKVAHFCGHSSYADDRGVLHVSFYHSSDTLDLRITSNLDGTPSQKSWAIRAIHMHVGHQGTIRKCLCSEHAR